MKKMLKVNMLRLLLGMSTLVFLGISGSFTAYAGDTPAAPQQHKRVVKGRVTDKKTGEPIVGATVWFKESTSGTATDAAGNYSLNRPQGNAILSVSFIGYKSQEVVLGKEDVINFQLEETSEMIEEAVVVGYGSQRKESVIGAITTVGVAELNNRRDRSVTVWRGVWPVWLLCSEAVNPGKVPSSGSGESVLSVPTKTR